MYQCQMGVAVNQCCCEEQRVPMKSRNSKDGAKLPEGVGELKVYRVLEDHGHPRSGASSAMPLPVDFGFSDERFSTNVPHGVVALEVLSAKSAVEMLRSGRVTPKQLIDVSEARIFATDPEIHATPITAFQRSRKTAENLQHPSNPPPGYLWGLPVLIKDLEAVQGVPCTLGSTLFVDHVAEHSDPLVLQLEAMGAIVIGKTNTAEFGAGGQTFNDVFPPTSSPYDVRTTAGGSSGGSAAALAACQCWLATGSDVDGSLRIPAAFCGVVGFRNSPGQMPSIPSLGAAIKGCAQGEATSHSRGDLHGVHGGMARSVQDLALLLDALTERHAPGTSHRWDSAAPPVLPRGGSWQSVAQLGACRTAKYRVAFSDLGCPVAHQVHEACRAAAALLAGDRGLNTIEQPFSLQKAERAFYVLYSQMFAKEAARMTREQVLMLKPEIRWLVESFGNLLDAEASVEQALNDCEDVESEVTSLFDEIDILATPATIDASFDAEIRYPVEGYGSLQKNERFNDFLAWTMPSCLVSTTSCPALVMPVGKLLDGRPIGIQLVGARGSDLRVLEAAAALEVALRTGMWRGCPVTRHGTFPLRGRGPRTAEEAEQHHAHSHGTILASK